MDSPRSPRGRRLNGCLCALPTALLVLEGALGAQEPTRGTTPGRPGAGLPPFALEAPPPPLQPAKERKFTDAAQPVLTLAQAVALALRQNPQMSAAAANALIVEARINQVRSGWLPQINLNASLNGSYAYQTGLSGDAVPDRRQARYNGQLSVSQLLTDFGRTSARIEGARAAARGAQGDLDQWRAQIALNAVTAYCSVLQYEALYQSVALNLAQQRQRVLQAESFLRIGTRPEIDVLTARTAEAQAELQMLQMQNNVLQGRVQLLLSLGVTDPTWLRRPLEPVPLSADPVESASAYEVPPALLEQALQTRPDLRGLRERVVVAEQSLRAARAQYRPVLSVNGAAGLSGNIGGSSTGNVGGQIISVPTNGAPTLSLSGALVLNWGAFDGLLTPYQIREAEAALTQAQANLEVLRQQVRGTLQQALFGVQTARQSVLAAQAVETQAALQEKTAMGRYQAGVGNIIEVGDALSSAANARAQRAQAEFTLALARATLHFQLGTLAPTDAAANKAPEGVR